LIVEFESVVLVWFVGSYENEDMMVMVIFGGEGLFL